MGPDERVTDRRAELRFEILGDLWATLVTHRSLPILNMGLGGMLVESPVPLRVGSLQRLRLFIRDDESEVTASVRHVTPAPARPDSYLVGLAFADVSDAARDRIRGLVGQSFGMAAQL